jgi:hypothetical protein
MAAVKSPIFSMVLLVTFGARALLASDYQVGLSEGEDLAVIPVTFDLNEWKGREIFASPALALVVDDIKIDGVSIVMPTRETRVDFFSIEKIELRSNHYTYIVPVEEKFTFTRIQKASEDSPGLFSYRFPKKWKEIEVRYRVKFPDATISREFTTLVTRSELGKSPK